jgi:hypothetical protein
VDALVVGRTPSSAPDPLVRLNHQMKPHADEGVGRGPGGPAPHYLGVFPVASYTILPPTIVSNGLMFLI